jgi:release factor glutamine methyltransferase
MGFLVIFGPTNGFVMIVSDHKYSLKQLHREIHDQLLGLYDPNESRQLTLMVLEHCCEVTPEQVLIGDSIYPPDNSISSVKSVLSELLEGKPIQYILGYAHFYGRKFLVNPSVLIPRQETEELVKLVLSKVTHGGMKLLDIGSGSGCIGITLATECNDLDVTALDIDPDALKVTKFNAQMHGVNIRTIQADILSMNRLPDTYNIIVSNPPYVTESEKQLMHRNVREYEPWLALFVDDANPLIFFKQILYLAKKSLSPDGLVFFEINEQFGAEVVDLCRDEGYTKSELYKDLNGKNRMVLATC